ncbi:MAG: hypothetical protein CMJ32_09320 [Phycisphaerae bacterium]|nr:hypothetical protein [Phycisphaerae bacterium]
MHVLTKIFIVLVSLLSVMIVPLVVVNAKNASTWEGKFRESDTARAASKNAERSALASVQSMQSEHALEVQGMESQMSQLRNTRSRQLERIRQLESELVALQGQQGNINTNIEIMAQTGKANAELVESLVGELRKVRALAVESERAVVEVDEALSNVQAQLEVADAARRQLQEEVQRLSEEKDQALTTISKYHAYVGDLPDVRAGAVAGGGLRVPADRSLSATIIGVRRNDDSSLAEINAGSRDGVQPGWVLTIGDGSKYIGNLRIIEVDVNRSTGVIEHENATQGKVQIGQRAIARRGE